MKKLFCYAVLLFALGHVFCPAIFDKPLLVLLLLAGSPWLILFLNLHLKMKSAEVFGAKFEFLEEKTTNKAS